MTMHRTIKIAQRLSAAVDDAERGHTLRQTLIDAGCSDLSPADRRIMIREARVTLLVYALQYK